jgi:hypothetical protein
MLPVLAHHILSKALPHKESSAGKQSFSSVYFKKTSQEAGASFFVTAKSITQIPSTAPQDSP